MRSITITSDDPLYAKILGMLSGDDDSPLPQVDDEAESSDGDDYDGMDRKALKKLVREKCGISRISAKIDDDELRKMLRMADEGGDEEEEDEEEAEEEEAEEEAEEEDEEEAEEEEDDEDEIALEVGMKVKVKVQGKLQAAKVEKIDYESGKVKVRTVKTKKLYNVSPEKLEL